MIRTSLEQAAAGAAPRRSFRDRLVNAALVVLAFNVGLAIVFVGGWLAGWFHVSIDRAKAAQQWRLQVTLNTNQVADDVEETVEDTKRAVASLRSAAELDAVIGQVVQHDLARQELTVRSDRGEQVIARMSEATEIEVNGAQAAPSAVQPGDRVELVYRQQDGQNHAVEIERLERN